MKTSVLALLLIFAFVGPAQAQSFSPNIDHTKQDYCPPPLAPFFLIGILIKAEGSEELEAEQNELRAERDELVDLLQDCLDGEGCLDPDQIITEIECIEAQIDSI